MAGPRIYKRLRLAASLRSTVADPLHSVLRYAPNLLLPWSRLYNRLDPGEG